MTDPTPADAPATPRWQPLDSCQRRVLGVLIEKAKTTPAGYPMSVNAIVTGCNQKSNREPLMNLEAFDVEKALSELQALGVVTEIDWMGRAAKYRHEAYAWLGVSKTEIAVMTELLLRGEQTLGDLRGRAARMEPIADLAALKPVVDALVERRLMIELTPPGRGQIVSHNLYLEHEQAELRARAAGHRPSAAAEPLEPAPRADHAAVPGALAELSGAVAELRAEVERLREQVRELTLRVESRD